MMSLDRTRLRRSWHAWLDWDRRGDSGPRWLAWLWTVLFCLGMTFIFTLLGFAIYAPPGAVLDRGLWMNWFGRNLVVSLTIGALVHATFDVLRATCVSAERVRRWAMWQRSLFFSGVPMAGVLVGWPLGAWLARLEMPTRWWGSGPGQVNLLALLLLSMGISFALHHWFSARARESDALRRATEAQLRLLQGQIEPHFLFNTLATVQALMDHDLPRAKRMLQSFTDYLRSSLGSLRRQQATLGDELDLVDAYLHLMQMRMEDRLRYEIRADIALRDVPLPALVLQPLVENAIHHGLEPKREGGTVQVAARRDGTMLVIDVLDDGLGLGAPPRRRKGAGVALANLRERLAGLYGPQASFELADAVHGTRATLRLPLATAAA